MQRKKYTYIEKIENEIFTLRKFLSKFCFKIL